MRNMNERHYRAMLSEALMDVNSASKEPTNDYIEFGSGFLVQDVSLEQHDLWRQVALYAFADVEMSLQFLSHNVTALANAASGNGYHIHRVVIDETLRFDDAMSYIPPSSKNSPFVLSADPIVLVEPVAPYSIKPVVGRVRIPADVDLSGRVSPKLPRMAPVTIPAPRWEAQHAYEKNLLNHANNQRRRP